MFYLTMLFLLTAGHAICDFFNAFVSIHKDKHVPCDLIKKPGTNETEKIWDIMLFTHVVTHGAAVMVITGNFWLGITELVIHAVIDYSKNEKYFGFRTDQYLHYACKALYVLLIWLGIFAVHPFNPFYVLNI